MNDPATWARLATLVALIESSPNKVLGRTAIVKLNQHRTQGPGDGPIDGVDQPNHKTRGLCLDSERGQCLLYAETAFRWPGIGGKL